MTRAEPTPSSRGWSASWRSSPSSMASATMAATASADGGAKPDHSFPSAIAAAIPRTTLPKRPQQLSLSGFSSPDRSWLSGSSSSAALRPTAFEAVGAASNTAPGWRGGLSELDRLTQPTLGDGAAIRVVSAHPAGPPGRGHAAQRLPTPGEGSLSVDRYGILTSCTCGFRWSRPTRSAATSARNDSKPRACEARTGSPLATCSTP